MTIVKSPDLGLADDDLDVRLTFEITLEEFTNYSISNFEVAEDGQGIIDWAKGLQDEPMLIFLDINMPVINGLEACRILRNDLGLTCPIAMLTSSKKEDEIKLAEQYGADAFLSKSDDPETQAKKVLEFISKKVENKESGFLVLIDDV